MRLLVCGGRNYSDTEMVYSALRELHPSVVITGGYKGADGLAYAWAYPVVPTDVYEADWGQYGRAAGPIRNQRMLDEGKPDAVLAFPGGRGTADMIRRAEAAGVRIIRMPADQPGATKVSEVNHK